MQQVPARILQMQIQAAILTAFGTNEPSTLCHQPTYVNVREQPFRRLLYSETCPTIYASNLAGVVVQV